VRRAIGPDRGAARLSCPTAGREREERGVNERCAQEPSLKESGSSHRRAIVAERRRREKRGRNAMSARFAKLGSTLHAERTRATHASGAGFHTYSTRYTSTPVTET
jgi:hypothetical protein